MLKTNDVYVLTTLGSILSTICNPPSKTSHPQFECPSLNLEHESFFELLNLLNIPLI